MKHWNYILETTYLDEHTDSFEHATLFDVLMQYKQFKSLLKSAHVVNNEGVVILTDKNLRTIFC